MSSAPKPADDPPEIRYKSHIEDALDRARALRDSVGGMEADQSRFIAFIRADLAKYRDVCEVEAKVFEKIAATYKTGDLEAVRKLRVEGEKIERGRLVWKVRINEIRVKQATAAPTEASYVEETRWIPAGVVPDLDRLVDAKRAASEAWARAAEAMTPDGDPDAANVAREAAYTSDAEREIAQWRFEAALYRERIAADKTVSSDDMARAVERLKVIMAKRETVRREQIARERQERENERDWNLAQRAYREAYDAAVLERNRQKAAQR
ncbi:MAG TPA: hypothetical protein VK986_18535 [Tepidisphaeraceae bacterium]|nr:hypothetical protein [Tepidisphaeraceae bacterium]